MSYLPKEEFIERFTLGPQGFLDAKFQQNGKGLFCHNYIKLSDTSYVQVETWMKTEKLNMTISITAPETNDVWFFKNYLPIEVCIQNNMEIWEAGNPSFWPLTKNRSAYVEDQYCSNIFVVHNLFWAYKCPI